MQTNQPESEKIDRAMARDRAPHVVAGTWPRCQAACLWMSGA